MDKKTYFVTLPITGYLVVEVEAENEKAAIKAAFESKLSKDAIMEWEAHERVVQGNIFHGMMNEAEAQEV